MNVGMQHIAIKAPFEMQQAVPIKFLNYPEVLKRWLILDCREVIEKQILYHYFRFYKP